MQEQPNRPQFADWQEPGQGDELFFYKGEKAGEQSEELWAVLHRPPGTAGARSCSNAARLTDRQGKGCSCLLMPIYFY